MSVCTSYTCVYIYTHVCSLIIHMLHDEHIQKCRYTARLHYRSWSHCSFHGQDIHHHLHHHFLVRIFVWLVVSMIRTIIMAHACIQPCFLPIPPPQTRNPDTLNHWTWTTKALLSCRQNRSLSDPQDSGTIWHPYKMDPKSDPTYSLHCSSFFFGGGG